MAVRISQVGLAEVRLAQIGAAKIRARKADGFGLARETVQLVETPLPESERQRCVVEVGHALSIGTS
jgi:hypothetical protein